jgi:hypothetical protein
MERRTRKSKVVVRNVFLVLLLTGLLCAPSARAEVKGEYSISWHTFTTCGGGTSTDPNYTVRGSIGQPFAEKRAEGLAKGEHLITGGFWGGAYKSWYPIFVKADARGDDNGTSWAHAFPSLQDAITLTGLVSKYELEICVAAGTYRPDTTGLEDLREATFGLASGVKIYGGFPSGGGSHLDRHPTNYETILSGDLNGDDHTVGDKDDNSYHVVTASNTDPNAMLNGFTVTAGYAYSNETEDQDGGGMYNEKGSASIVECTFKENMAEHYAGAVYNESGSPTFIGCTFKDNDALEDGGGMFNKSLSSPKVIQSLFVGNVAESGGAMYNYKSNPEVSCCNIIANQATEDCGGIYSETGGSPIFKNSIFWANHDGDAETTPSEEQIQFYNCTPENIYYCCVQDEEPNNGSIYPGIGNIDKNPNFFDMEGGNYHLTMFSPCINAGDPSYEPIENLRDMDSQPRIVGCRVDMGIDEYVQAEDLDFSGSISLGDLAVVGIYWLDNDCSELLDVEEDWCAGADLNRDSTVGLVDLYLLTGHWLDHLPGCEN